MPQNFTGIETVAIILRRQMYQPRLGVSTAEEHVQPAERQPRQRPVAGIELSGHIRNAQTGCQPVTEMFAETGPCKLMRRFTLYVIGNLRSASSRTARL